MRKKNQNESIKGLMRFLLKAEAFTMRNDHIIDFQFSQLHVDRVGVLSAHHRVHNLCSFPVDAQTNSKFHFFEQTTVIVH